MGHPITIVILLISLTLNLVTLSSYAVFRSGFDESDRDDSSSAPYRCTYEKTKESKFPTRILFYSIWKVLCERPRTGSLSSSPDEFYYLIVSVSEHERAFSEHLPIGQLVTRSFRPIEIRVMGDTVLVSTEKGALIESLDRFEDLHFDYSDG